jgi:serine/threonine protein kinase
MTLATGTRLGAYEILSLLGTGAMGEVYRARDTRLLRDVAIKVLPDEVAQTPGRLTRFQLEARAIAAVNHPCIAAIYDVQEHQGTRFLVLELVEGETLAERVGRGPLPLDEALTIATQIAGALDAAHAKAIVHRDLKPGNVQITPDGKVKVLDFGIAKMHEPAMAWAGMSSSETTVSAATVHDTIVGTPAYMSPEQARGNLVDARADIWAFGCVVFEMLTGKQAFGRETTVDTFAAIARDEPDWQALPATTPSSIRTLLDRCLQKELKTRLRDIGDAQIEVPDSNQAAAGSSSAETDLEAQMSSLRQRLLAAPSGRDLQVLLYETDALLSRFPHNPDGRILRDEIERAIWRDEMSRRPAEASDTLLYTPRKAGGRAGEMPPRSASGARLAIGLLLAAAVLCGAFWLLWRFLGS